MKTYTIKKGKHKSGFRLPRVFFRTPKKMTVRVGFHRNCWYQPSTDSVDWNDINKLCGFSQGRHHKNSYRIGWLPNFERKGIINLYHYSYSGGKRDFVKFESIATGDYYDLNFEIRAYAFGGLQIIADNFSNEPHISQSWFGYFLYPYFGGDLKSPIKMEIDLEMKIEWK